MKLLLKWGILGRDRLKTERKMLALTYTGKALCRTAIRARLGGKS